MIVKYWEDFVVEESILISVNLENLRLQVYYIIWKYRCSLPLRFSIM